MFDIWGGLRSGGRVAIDLLEYSVLSAHLEILFVHLANEYRNQPSALRAIALYDAFCAQGAPARIHAPAALPPADLGLASAIGRIREEQREIEAWNATDPEEPRVVPFPPRHLLDAVCAAIRSADHPIIRQISETWEPGRGPLANLPGGRQSAGQRSFVERVWKPALRPLLVRSGFPRVSSLGG